MVADKGYHSNEVLQDLAALEMRSYISEPDRGRRRWRDKGAAQAAVYANRRRIRGERGKRLLRQRGERVERSFAHLYERGGMRRTHLRGHPDILKRLLIHAGAFNLSLLLRKRLGAGTPRALTALKKGPGRALRATFRGPRNRSDALSTATGRRQQLDPLDDVLPCPSLRRLNR